MNSWVTLFGAIVFELLGTSSLKHSNGFQNLVPSILVFVGYGLALFMLSIAVKQIPLGTAYAIWSGLGTFGALLIGYLFFDERIGPVQILGVVLIVVGTVVLKWNHPTGVGE